VTVAGTLISSVKVPTALTLDEVIDVLVLSVNLIPWLEPSLTFLLLFQGSYHMFSDSPLSPSINSFTPSLPALNLRSFSQIFPTILYSGLVANSRVLTGQFLLSTRFFIVDHAVNEIDEVWQQNPVHVGHVSSFHYGRLA